ncbi:Cell cycle checkpoint protein rad17 [Linnemannia schmuckeri]|uniref:Cell cycle checkpoint protein rad17 n=1 Tax=Linnemannia schmuckeri TaxID=64567 RepID=A0A9P5RX85_9FUNG|nr:Cell cycle checkpoint protein rad17 [Linnemannia schmuckeri]
MPPKRTTSTAAPVPRRAPTREAKTRSAATTASLYKDSEAYMEEDFLSDISDPASEIESDTLDGVIDSEEETFTRPRGGRAKKAPANGASNGSKWGTATTAATKKTKPPKNSGSPAEPTCATSTSTAGSKRKASELKFSPLGMSPSSSQSSPSVRSSSNTPILSPLAGGPESAEDQWAEKYAPRNIQEVVIHKNKINDVREWLRIYTSPYDTRRDTSGGAILVLTGPAGSGKTAVLRNLAQEMGLHIVEWINSINANNIIQRPVMPGQEKEAWRPASLDEEYAPVMRSFQEFFSRAHRFSPLQLSSGKPQQSQTQNTMGGHNSSSPTSASSATEWMQTPRTGPGKKNIILIEDLPPVSALSSRKIFQDTIHNFANSRASSSSVLVIIVSDVFSKQSTELQFSNTRESSDPALTMRTLLPPSVLGKLDSGAKNDNARIRQIKFNPIAPTFVKKALKKLMGQEFRSRSTYAPDSSEIEQLIEIYEGDIRAIINALQFMCYLPSKRRQQFRKAAKQLEEDMEGLSTLEWSLQGQDSSLGIFHAVAKVMYNKRDWSGPQEEFDCDIVKDLIEKLPVEPDLYTLMLHQNYTKHMNSIEECATAMEYLCVADRFQSHPSFGNAGYTQTMQMQPYMTSVVVRGMLFAPTSAGPASANSFGGPKKHFWPEFFAVNRTARANDEMFSEVAHDLAGREAHGLATGSVTGPGFIPKAVIRQELVPMLHKCLLMDPYRPIFQQLLRGSSKTFVRHGAGAYGTKAGIVKKEFGEGDEGFTEELDAGADSTPSSSGVADEIGGSQGSRARSGSGFGTGYGKGKVTGQQQRTPVDPSIVDDDPIEDFSD